MSYSYSISDIDAIDDDTGENQTTRCVSFEEFVERIRNRRDIFAMEGDSRINWTEGVCLTFAIILGLWLDTRHIITATPTDFIEKKLVSNSNAIRAIPEMIDRNPPARIAPQPAKRVTINHPRHGNPYRAGIPNGGVGNPTSRIMKTGIFAYIGKPIKGIASATGDPAGLGGYASAIDAIISGVGGLHQGGGTGSGRRTEAGMGFGSGYGPGGFGGEPGGGIDGLINSLMNPSDVAISLKPSKHSVGILSEPTLTYVTGGAVGGRSRESIFRTLMENMQTLRYAYNRWLREDPTLKGKMTVKFAIDEFGKVLHCEIVDSFTDKPEINNRVAEIIKRWNFGKVDKPGDITEVVYPLVFSM
jgi:hypothetical protein